MRRAAEVVGSAAHSTSPLEDAWVSIALSFQGLKALGLPEASLGSFAPEFREGMAARTSVLGDTGTSSPPYWEKPLGTPEVHVVLTAIAPETRAREPVLERARKAYQTVSGITVVRRHHCHALPDNKGAFGFKDGIGQPEVEGSGIPGSNLHEQPIKAGEFVLGYANE